MKRIVALDPGGTTGIRTWSNYTKEGVVDNDDHWGFDQIGPEEHHDRLWDYLKDTMHFVWGIHGGEMTIVCESFEFRQWDGNRAGINLISREYIGVAKLFGQRYGVPVVLQSAGNAKGFIPDKPVNGMEANAKLKVMGLYLPGKKHANDAARHLIYYMVNTLKRHDLIESWRTLT